MTGGPRRLWQPTTLQEWRSDPRYPQRFLQHLVPDAMKDSPARRRRRAGPWRERAALLREHVGPLQVVTLTHPGLDGANLYDPEVVAHMDQAVRAFLAQLGVHDLWKHECGRDFGLHTHLVLPADVTIDNDVLSKEVGDLDGLMNYLAKPGDARGCRPRPTDLGRFSLEELTDQREAAADEYLAATAAAKEAGGRLPSLHGHNLPRAWINQAAEQRRAAERRQRRRAARARKAMRRRVRRAARTRGRAAGQSVPPRPVQVSTARRAASPDRNCGLNTRSVTVALAMGFGGETRTSTTA